MLDAVCLGEALIDLVSTAPVKSVADAPSFVPAPGGSPANTAVAMARLGVRTGFIGKVGDDPFGRHLARTFAANGVDTACLRFDPDARTALAFVALDEVGHPDFVFFRHPSADMLLRESDLDADYLARAAVFHTGSIILAAEPSRSATVAAMRLARSAGRLVSLDPNVRLSQWGSEDELRRVILPLFGLADVVKLSEEDMAVLVGTGDASRGSEEVFKLGPRLVVVTRGKDGCFCRTESATLAVSGYEVPAIDTTGAGDAFVAGLVAGLLRAGVPDRDVATLDETTLRAILTLANAVGAITTTVRGAIPALPNADSLRSFLADRAETAALALLGGKPIVQ